jgi:hypothetical protein
MALENMRDFAGMPDADVQTLYTATLAAYQVSLKGPYVIKGVTYTPPAPKEVLDALSRISNELLRRTIQPKSPDLGMIQTEFDGVNPMGSTLPGKGF